MGRGALGLGPRKIVRPRVEGCHRIARIASSPPGRTHGVPAAARRWGKSLIELGFRPGRGYVRRNACAIDDFAFRTYMKGWSNCREETMDAPVRSSALADEVAQVLARLHVPRSAYTGGTLAVTSPITGEVVARVPETDAAAVASAIDRAHKASLAWRTVPAPKRGELVRLF